jgi:hypothetical protein
VLADLLRTEAPNTLLGIAEAADVTAVSVLDFDAALPALQEVRASRQSTTPTALRLRRVVASMAWGASNRRVETTRCGYNHPARCRPMTTADGHPGWTA